MKEKNGFLKNTAILFFAMFCAKIIGAVFKIPLTNMIGGVGMGYFSTAYSFFVPVYTILGAGFPVIVIRMTAQSIAVKKYREARNIKSAAIMLAAFLGLLGTAFMLLLAVPFSDYAAASSKSLLSVLAISPSVFICCVAAAYKGYYEGLSNMLPTAVSQVLESAVKAAMGLGLSGTVLYLGQSGIIEKENIIPYCAAAAVLGVTLGELSGMTFLAIRSKMKGDGITAEDLKSSPPSPRKRHIAKNILIQSLPISFGSAVISLGSFIDLLTISGGIQECFAKNADYFRFMYKSAVNEAGAEQFGSFVYGSYNGIVLSIFMLITSLTALIGKSALPSISAAYERGERQEVKRNISILITGIFVIGLPLCLCLGALAEPVLKLLYPMRAAEVSISTVPLAIICFGGIPIALCSGFFSVFHAIGRYDLPVKLMMLCSAVKLILNLLLIRIPQLSVCGAAISTVAAHLITAVLGYFALKSSAQIEISILSLISKPFAASAACCLCALLSYYLLFNNFGGVIRILLTIVLSGLLYMLILTMLDKRIFSAIKSGNL